MISKSGIAAQWNNYVKIRLNLFDNSVIEKLFSQYQTKFENDKTVDFIPRITFNRNQIGNLMSIAGNTYNNTVINRIQAIDKLSKASKNDKYSNLLLKYHIIWSGMYRIWNTFDKKWFSTITTFNNNKNKEENKSNNNNTNINFDATCLKFFQDRLKQTGNWSEKNVQNNSNYSNDCKKLIEYCSQDIENSSVLEYNFKDCGICFYLINRMSFVLLNDLFLASNTSNTNKIEFLGLRDNLFKFLWDFSIYTILYPIGKQESLYISNYFKFKKSMFNPSNLTKFNYFNWGEAEGTLLHKAVSMKMAYYSEVLLKLGNFNPQQLNSRNETALDIAQKMESTPIVSKLNEYEEKKSSGGTEGAGIGVTASDVESAYFTFKNQKQFSKFLLLTFKTNDNDKFQRYFNQENLNLGLEHKKFEIKGVDVNCYTDEFFHNLWDCGKLAINSKTKSDTHLEDIVLGVMKLLQTKCGISDDWLIFCFEYCKMLCIGDDESLLNKFNKTLENVIRECLDSDYQSKHAKFYNYFWFKHFLLHSNIWLCRLPNMHSKNSSNSYSSSLYCQIGQKTVSSALIKQQTFIWKHIKEEEKNNGENWDKLLHFKEVESKNEYLRQDEIDNGIKSEQGYENIYPMLPLMDKTSNFDVFNQYNSIYLRTCLIFAHKINPTFQNDMKNLFLLRNINSKLKVEIERCDFAKAPVKMYERSIMKAQTDYIDRGFPTTSSIVDFLRCSVTFNNSNDMLSVIKYFIDKIEANEAGCVIGIARIKNGFKNIIHWKEIKDCNYCDIKINVIIYDSLTNTSQIGEIQFLLKWLLKAKKIGHKLYGVARKQEYIEAVYNLIDNDSNYEQYKMKISKLISNGNVNYFGKELIWQPNVVLSMISKESNNLRPFLYICGNKFGEPKMFELFLGCLFHFSQNMLLDNTSSTSNNSFLSKYFNFNSNKHLINSIEFVKF